MKLRKKIIISALIVIGVVTGFLVSSQRQLPAKQMVDNKQYTRLELAEVESYASTSDNNFVVTSGTVVGIKLDPFYQLVLSDGKGTHVMVTFARVDTDQFAPIFSSLRVGDTVEVMGIASVNRGILISSPEGTTIETIGVNLANAPYFGVISLAGTGITKIDQ